MIIDYVLVIHNLHVISSFYCLISKKNILISVLLHDYTGQVGLGVGSWPSNRATEGSNPKSTLLYFVILLTNVEKIFD